jgi:hypothetical protein
MNEELKKLAKNGNKTDFEKTFKFLNPNAGSGDWKLAYNAALAESRNSRTSSSTSDSSSSSSSNSSQNTGGTNALLGGLAGGAVSALGKVLGISSDVIKGIAKLSNETIESQMGKEGGNNSSINKILGIIQSEGLNPVGLSQGTANLLKEEALSQLKEESKLLSEVNSKTGISGELSKGLREDMVLAQVEASRYGITLSDIGGFYTDLSDQSGKFALINRTTIEEAVKVAGALDMSMSNLAGTIGEFENVGIGAQEAIKTVGEAATKAVSLGLNASKVATEMKSSIKDLNSYGFQNGVKGLERMVQKSIEFKLSMSSVLKIADEVMDADKAINLAANLQVLGGAIGSFGDPLKMMYEATNNVEGLQDSLIGAASSLATYNQEQGRFEITGINLRRAREMSKALNVDMGELTKSAIASQERLQASTALMSTGLQMKDKDKEFLTNLGRMQGGEMKIVVPESLQDKLGQQSEITLSKLTEEQKKVLLANKKAFEEMNPKDMAMAQLTEAQAMSRGIDVVAAYYRVLATQKLKGAAEGALSPEFKALKNSIDTYSQSLRLGPNEKEKVKEKVEGIKGTSIDAESLKSEVEKLKNLIDFNNIGKNIMQTIDKNINLTINSNNQGDALRRDMERNSSVVAEIKNLTTMDDRKFV